MVVRLTKYFSLQHLKTDSENIRLGPSGLGFGKPRGAKKPQEKPAAHATAIRNSYGVFAEGDAEPVSHESPQTSRESSRSRREESPSIRDSKNISLAASPVPTPSQLSRDNSRTGSPDRVPTIENLDKYATQLLEEFVVSNDLKVCR